ncbi:hypothetical protein SISSUDRAFT_1050617 [Sistotremastrum suecicum HHB10207 ss-3]|uniref:Zn(2)-C6 fungal-type domain-containing protein n=1 Tax=Sistotremastrum suecicum HHB10207 ss-3 TaxID=1314776 RepID=A0A166B2U6_9AGAM|nr:hypothetical protein SISSUDRAFT_1050617 [Sistotremastrum suecicum HHB10207 ss-3]
MSTHGAPAPIQDFSDDSTSEDSDLPSELPTTTSPQRASRTAASNGASVLLAAAASAETSSAYALGPASWNSAGNAQPGPSQYPSQYVTNTPRTPATRTGVSLPRVNMACRSCRYSKLRCDPPPKDSPIPDCGRCLRQRKVCEWPEKRGVRGPSKKNKYTKSPDADEDPGAGGASTSAVQTA